jgi:hypothetical protein
MTTSDCAEPVAARGTKAGTSRPWSEGCLASSIAAAYFTGILLIVIPVTLKRTIPAKR